MLYRGNTDSHRAMDGMIVSASLPASPRLLLRRQIADVLIVQIQVHERAQLALRGKQIASQSG